VYRKPYAYDYGYARRFLSDRLYRSQLQRTVYGYGNGDYNLYLS
jgi:hypothetical protein